MPNRRTAFTLVELLVVVAIAALLLGILVPAVGKARQVAQQVAGMSDLKQVMLGYAMYHQDHDGAVLWGKPPWTVAGESVKVHAPWGQTYGGAIATRYPWRLAPHLEYEWDVLFSHTDPPRPSDETAYGLSIKPSFGINSVYVGGHDGRFDGFVSDMPNTDAHVVFRDTEVRRPADLITFTESQARIGDDAPFDDPQRGTFWVTPPHADGENWTATDGQVKSASQGRMQGLPIGRHGEQTITAFFDGHVETLYPDKLDDMRLWANEADEADYDFK